MTGKSLVFLKNTAPIKLLSRRECVFLPIMHILKTPTRDQGSELIELNSFFPTDYIHSLRVRKEEAKWGQQNYSDGGLSTENTGKSK